MAIAGLDFATDGALSRGGGAAAKEAAARGGIGGAAGNLMAMLGLRSPGERPDGALVDTKARPFADVMSERDGPEPKPAPAPSRPGIIPPPPLAERDSLPDVPILAEIAPPPGTVSIPEGTPSPPPIAPTPPGPIGGGGGGGGFVPPSTPPITPPSGVPEPEAWMTMVLGFGLAGAAMRRKRRLERQASRRLESATATAR